MDVAMLLLPRLFFNILQVFLFSSLTGYVIGPYASVTGDVIGQYTLDNDKQCERLCWYRKLCTGFRYHSGGLSIGVSIGPNCVLYTGGKSSIAPSSISNGCKARLCGEAEVCVPTSSLSALASSNSADYVCHPMPSQCGDPAPVTNADVIVTGRRQDDVAKVVCQQEFLFPSRNRSTQIKCLVTSKWTSVVGHCIRYEFRGNRSDHANLYLPWSVGDQREVCVKGTFIAEGQFFVNMYQPSHSTWLHIMFRYKFNGITGVYWARADNDNYSEHRQLGPMPLVPGDAFTLSLLLLTGDMLKMGINQTHNYTIQLNSAAEGTDGIKVSDLKVMGIGGKVTLTYYNLLSTCSN